MTTTHVSLRRRSRAFVCTVAAALASLPSPASARTSSPPPTAAPVVPAGPVCRSPAAPLTLRLPGAPLSIAQTPDGCYLFIGLGVTSGTDPHRGVVLLHREGRSYAFVRLFDIGGSTTALAMSRDGLLLAASVLDHGVVLLDVARAIGGDPASVAADLIDPSVKAPGALAFDAEGSKLYVVDRTDSAVLAIDVATARRGPSARSGLFQHRMPLDLGPVGLALAPGGARLYVAVGTRSPAKNLAEPCRTAYTPGAGVHQPSGALVVLDLAHADRDGVAPTLARLDAGCTPTALAVADDGATLWISSAGQRVLLAFDTASLGGDGTKALAGRTPLTFAPDVVATVAGGAYVVAAGYDRASDLSHDFAVVPRATTLGGSTLKARVLVGRFPRAALGLADGAAAAVASYSANTLSIFPLSYLRDLIEPPVRLHGRPPARPRRRERPSG